MDIKRRGDSWPQTYTVSGEPTCADIHLSKLFSSAPLWKKNNSNAVHHTWPYISICAIFSWLAVIKCASLIGRVFLFVFLFFQKNGARGEWPGSTLIRCCCWCCRDLCTADLLRCSWCRGFSHQTGQRTSRSPFFDHEMAYTAGRKW